MTLLNIAYTLKWDFNLILLKKFYELRIFYYIYLDSTIFKNRNTNRVTNAYKNHFIFKISSKTILIRK